MASAARDSDAAGSSGVLTSSEDATAVVAGTGTGSGAGGGAGAGAGAVHSDGSGHKSVAADAEELALQQAQSSRIDGGTALFLTYKRWQCGKRAAPIPLDLELTPSSHAVCVWRTCVWSSRPSEEKGLLTQARGFLDVTQARDGGVLKKVVYRQHRRQCSSCTPLV